MPVHNISRYAMINVPRYTSYPTAPHFHAEVGPDTYARWLGQLSTPDETSSDTVSLYLHVPFCREICSYCGCQTKASRKEAPLQAYGDVLAEEVRLVGSHLTRRPKVMHIHWGGGTPSLLPDASFQNVLAEIYAWFDCSPTMEHAIELDPRLVTSRLARNLSSYGVTRVSLGVQDFNPRVQTAIGRIQPIGTVRTAVQRLNDAGLHAINMDVMYGLPHQSLEDVVNSATVCADLGADRIALFGYAHVPWMKKNQRLIDEAALPCASRRLEQVRAAHRALEHLGYVSIGFDHFARPDNPMAHAMRCGKLKRNFQGYTTDTATTLIGFGASSIGKFSQGYVQNSADTRSWTRAIEAGLLATARGYAMQGEDTLRAEIIEELLTGFHTDLSAQRGGICPDQHWINEQLIALDDLADDGLCEVMGNEVSIPKDARFLARLVASRFDVHASKRVVKHSAAV
ncbi:MAG: oxygen-independent coproporphyrinogen III oxidase [Pseudomonadota bacterium]